MYNYSGWIARSAAGHDKGTLLCVVGIDQGGQRLLVADGKRRRVALSLIHIYARCPPLSWKPSCWI